MTAQEYVAEIWRQYQEKQKNRGNPQRVILSSRVNRLLGEYRRSLGSLPDQNQDYLQENSIFGLEIYLDETEDCRVE